MDKLKKMLAKTEMPIIIMAMITILVVCVKIFAITTGQLTIITIAVLGLDLIKALKECYIKKLDCPDCTHYEPKHKMEDK